MMRRFNVTGSCNPQKQIAEYLDFYGLKKGYMLTFNFNQHKEVGVTERQYGDKVLIEAIV